MGTPQLRYIAVDWSGAASPYGQRKNIVAADYEAGVITLTAGRTRAETFTWLMKQASRTPSLVVGLDFAFSFPAWFVKQQGAAAIEDFWRLVESHGEDWLASCNDPFWGRPGRCCPPDHRTPEWRGYRQADRLIQNGNGVLPKSPFQIGGAGSVGTGSIRGIPALLALRRAGFSIWPFHAILFPMIMEIYPRAFTGPVVKSSRGARAEYLSKHLGANSAASPTIPAEVRTIATESEDAFDALCSVIGMARHASEILQLRLATDETIRLEGSIFPAKPLWHSSD